MIGIRLVRDLADDPARWPHLVRPSADQRNYEGLHGDDDVAVWLICWMNDHDTVFHHHDLSRGAVAVVAGEIAEDRLALGGPPVTRTFEAGEAFHFSAADIDRVRHAGEVLLGGELRRHSLFSAEELRPLA